MTSDREWIDITRRNARSVQTTIGWIFWDPTAVASYDALGLPGPLGYIAARAAPLAPAGPDAVIAAFGSISAVAIRIAFDLVATRTTFDAVWHARDDAVVAGLRAYAPEIVEPLVALASHVWEVVEQLPTAGRVFFAAHLRMPRPADPLLSGWHAVNCVREWRGDTHWALVAAAGLDGIEASILHNAWLGYERDWLPRSRGSAPDEIDTAWASLSAKDLVVDGAVTTTGIALRQHLEDETDRLTTTVWRLLGEDASRAFARDFEPPCERLLRRVDETAGPNYQPASRARAAGHGRESGMTGRIVVLNGTSSAGKTSIATAFKENRAAAGECWVVVALDDYLAKLPRRWIEVGAWVGSLAGDGVRLETHGDRSNFHIGETARRLMRGYRRSVRELARAGVNVIVDEVSLQEDEWLDWCDALDTLAPVWVAVRCDVEVAARREAARGDRAIGLVRGQADVVHRFPAYAAEIDTTATPVEEAVQQLADLLASQG